MSDNVQGNTRHNVSRHKNTASAVVLSHLADGTRKEKSLKLSTRTGFRIETEGGLVSNDEDTCRDGKGNVLLQGIIEADETYIGGKGRKDYDRLEAKARKRGRGTAKDAVIGAVQRGGKVVARLVENVKGRTIAEFIKQFVKTEASELITDQIEATMTSVRR